MHGVIIKVSTDAPGWGEFREEIRRLIEEKRIRTGPFTLDVDTISLEFVAANEDDARIVAEAATRARFWSSVIDQRHVEESDHHST